MKWCKMKVTKNKTEKVIILRGLLHIFMRLERTFNMKPLQYYQLNGIKYLMVTEKEWDSRNLSTHGYLLKAILENQKVIMEKLLYLEREVYNK